MAASTTSPCATTEQWWPTLRRLAAFDVVANNADRKSGHVLLAEDRLWAIDNGLCFHEEPKLRTVVWDFAAEALDTDVLADLRRLVHDGIGPTIATLLDDDEQDTLIWRAESLLDRAELPVPRDDGRWPPYPWPLV